MPRRVTASGSRWSKNSEALVSNFYPDRLADLILHNQILPAVNQIETHPFFQRQADQDFMTERGVQIES